MSDTPQTTQAREFIWPSVRALAPGAMARWLGAAWADFKAAPATSLFYGVVLAAMGIALTRYFRGAVGIALTTGFLLVGPFLAIGLYDLSRHRESGRAPNLATSLTAWRSNFPAIGFYALILTLLLAVWIRVSVVVVAIFFPDRSIDWTSPEVLVFTVVYFAVGALFAVFVFATTSLSLPLLLDRRDMDTISAAIVSFKALRTNFLTMVTWAVLIVVLTAAGFATYFVGLVLVLPLVGHMTWHAYRETIAPYGDSAGQTSPSSAIA